MAICEACHQEMRTGVGCTLTQFDDMNGGPYLRIPYESDNGNCRDCFVPDGQLHHPGCDVERCPNSFIAPAHGAKGTWQIIGPGDHPIWLNV